MGTSSCGAALLLRNTKSRSFRTENLFDLSRFRYLFRLVGISNEINLLYLINSVGIKYTNLLLWIVIVLIYLRSNRPIDDYIINR